MTLPWFKYHPDPLKTGAIKPSRETCACCGAARGFIYAGPTYGTAAREEAICPWCIADGSAHRKLDVIFTDDAGIGGGGTWEDVPQGVIEEVAFRTPGFCTWQQEEWWTHCGDAGAFLGCAGKAELLAFGPEAVQAIQDSVGLDAGEEWEEFLGSLDKEGSPRAYIFRCLHCGKLGGYQDCD